MFWVQNYIQCTKLTLKNMDWCQKNWSNFPNVNNENLNVKFLWSNLKGYLLTFWSMILKKIWCWELGAPRPTSLGPRPEFTYSKMNDSEIKGQCHRPSTLLHSIFIHTYLGPKLPLKLYCPKGNWKYRHYESVTVGADATDILMIYVPDMWEQMPVISCCIGSIRHRPGFYA